MENPTSLPRRATPPAESDGVAPAPTVTDDAGPATEDWLPPLAPTAGRLSVPSDLGPPQLDPGDAEPPGDEAPVATRPSQPVGFWKLVLAGTVGALVTVAALWLTGALDREAGPEASVPSTNREIITVRGDGASPRLVAQKVTPSIVTVEVGVVQDGEFAPFGSGSGVVLTSEGLIATNHHVIEDSGVARVVFQDGSIHQATLVGSDPLTDLAVLQVVADRLTPVELGSTSSLSIGDTAIAIGNPLAQRGGASLTVGVVSAFNRDVEINGGDRLFGMIQTDAPITQGSSGGALVDDSGRLIGITTAIGVSSAGAEGIGYAIPVELMTRITDEIIATGAVRHPFLGVVLEDSFEERDGVSIPNGTVITEFVAEVRAAQDAGMEIGDVLVSFEDTSVRTLDDLVNSIRLYNVGEVVTIGVLREGTVVEVEVTLAERPDDL